MAECISDFYIKNNKLLKKATFDNHLVFNHKSLYTVIRITNGVALFWEAHYERLIKSSEKAGLPIWLNKSEIKSKINQLISNNSFLNGNIKLVFNFSNASKDKRNFAAYYCPHHYPNKELYANGISTITLDAERINPNIKLINQNLREITNKLIKEKNVYEIILVDRKGNITEGSRSNIFMMKNDEIITPPVKDVLPGITRACVLKICKSLNLKVSEKKIHKSQINELDGVFISGTSPKILPVNKIDNFTFTSENILLHKIMKEYDNIISDYIKSNKVKLY